MVAIAKDIGYPAHGCDWGILVDSLSTESSPGLVKTHLQQVWCFERQQLLPAAIHTGSCSPLYNQHRGLKTGIVAVSAVTYLGSIIKICITMYHIYHTLLITECSQSSQKDPNRHFNQEELFLTVAYSCEPYCLAWTLLLLCKFHYVIETAREVRTFHLHHVPENSCPQHQAFMSDTRVCLIKYMLRYAHHFGGLGRTCLRKIPEFLHTQKHISLEEVAAVCLGPLCRKRHPECEYRAQ